MRTVSKILCIGLVALAPLTAAVACSDATDVGSPPGPTGTAGTGGAGASTGTAGQGASLFEDAGDAGCTVGESVRRRRRVCRRRPMLQRRQDLRSPVLRGCGGMLVRPVRHARQRVLDATECATYSNCEYAWASRFGRLPDRCRLPGRHRARYGQVHAPAARVRLPEPAARRSANLPGAL